jgi:hypothetical protein
MKNEGTQKIATPTDREMVLTRAFVERGAGESYDRLAEVPASCR